MIRAILTNALERTNLHEHLRRLRRSRMHETLVERWHRENLADRESPSVLHQCVTGAVRGGLLGIGLLAALFLVGWIGLL